MAFIKDREPMQGIGVRNVNTWSFQTIVRKKV